jgi:hypothetical protein
MSLLYNYDGHTHSPWKRNCVIEISSKKERKPENCLFIYIVVVPFASPLDPPAPPLTVTGSVGSGLPIGSGDSSMLLFEAFFESDAVPSGFPLMI